MPDTREPSPPTGDNLSSYRAKRSTDRTPEPFGTVSSVPGNLFVVHKHAARQLHFDLRLEMDGVLRSWAVPRGPSYDMNDKRLAVRVEDHPLDYGDFEGVIPKGNYGAGTVIVWDTGPYENLTEKDGREVPLKEALERGHAVVALEGHKLHGGYVLQRIGRGEDERWLLVKTDDEG